jgi:uncharacterized protein YhdP
MVRLAAFATSVIWWSLLAILLMFALYAGIGRQLTRNIDTFSDDLAHALSARIGQDVAIGSLSSHWFWLDPSFTAQSISVTSRDSGVEVARLEHLQIRINFLSSLSRLRIVFEDFEADGLELMLDQSGTGQIGMSEVDLPAPASDQLKGWLELAGSVLSEPYVKITRVDLSILDRQGRSRQLDIPQLDLVYRQGVFHASGRAMQSGTAQQLAGFSLVGQHFFRGDFTGQLYVDVDSGRLFDGLIDKYQWRSMRVEGFDLGGEAWLTFRGGVLQQVTGTVRTPYLQLGVAQASLAPLENIQASFGWRRHEHVLSDDQPDPDSVNRLGEWHLKNLQWTWNGVDVPPFSLRLKPGEGGLSVVADALPLKPLRRLVSLLPILPAPASAALENYRPAGYLDNMELWLPEASAENFELHGNLREVSVIAHNGAPGAEGLYGKIYVNQNSGYVNARAGDQPVELRFPELFQSDWLFSGFRADVFWKLDGPVTRIYADDIELIYQGDTRIGGAFDLKLVNGGESLLGLRVSVQNANASMLADFVPAKVVSPGLYEWLTTAISKADTISGVYYGHGQINTNLPDNPFVSSMWYDFDNATVTYAEDWPEVTGAKGHVAVHNGDTRVTLEKGETGGLTLETSVVRVVPTAAETTILVDASASFPGEAVSRWENGSPLGEMIGTQAGALEFGGQYVLNLMLDLPLDTERDVVVDANVETDNGKISYPSAGLVWTDLKGNLAYHTAKGFSGGPMTANFFGEPVSISLSHGKSSNVISVRQTGKLSISDAITKANPEFDKSLGIKGVLSYTATLDVGSDRTSDIRIKSDLQGLSVDWPDPLAKTADQSTPLEAVIDPSTQEGIAIHGDWENRMTFDLLWKDTGFDLTFGHLYLGGHTLNDIQINALNLGDRWIISTDSERAVGRIVLPANNDPIIADLEVVRLVRSNEAREQSPELLTLEEQLETFRTLDMGDWPDVKVTIADLQLNGETLGRWAFTLKPEPYKLAIDSIEGKLNSLVLLGDMTWSIVDDRGVSQFVGSIAGGALADLGKLFGTQIPLTNKDTTIELNIDWPGRPDEFTMSDLSGSVSFRLDDGIILEQNNTAQLFRFFNLLNADTLWRRLKLDFSDLYERGVAFDAISGKARIVNGLVTMDPELQVVGPSGAFKLSGTTDITEEVLDMRLVVVLPLTQNLPLAALLMGAGAPIGGALFVLDKMLGDPLSKLTSASYSVTGTWDDPKVELRRVFDNGK